MPKPQPTFTAEFKHEAVQLACTSGRPKAQIARELGISDSALHAWCKQAEEHGNEAFPGKGHQMPEARRNSSAQTRVGASAAGA
jgi:transposase